MITRSNLRSFYVFIAATFCLASTVSASGKFVDKVFKDDTGDHKYVVYEPEGYSAERKWPVLMFLHGAGERGTDGRKQLDVGLAPVLKDRTEPFPFVVVFPQCEATNTPILTAWSPSQADGKRALAILDQVIDDYSIDSKQQSLTGWSMGGYGAVSLAAADPQRWKSIAILSGGGDPEAAAAIAKIPVWIFHGDRDRAVLPAESRDLADALRAADGHPKFSLLTRSAHDIWADVYRFDGLYRWLLDPSLDIAYVPPQSQPGNRPLVAADDKAPFVPALEIPKAVYLRMGNDMLTALAGSVPAKIPEDLLVGGIQDIGQTTSVEGRSFTVWFTNIGYSAKVTRAHVEAYRKDRLNIALGLSDIRMRIGRTNVSGSGRSAVAGPIDIVIGHREPVWLSVALEPYVENGRLRLKLIASRFDIPSNNWYVTSPAGVSTRGLGMTRERVSDGLVSGLYGSKARIEREVEGVVPGILEKLEENLDLSEAGNFLNNFWPLPVYQPRVKLWPQDVQTDENGVSILFGLTAAAVDPDRAPERIEVRPIEPIRLNEVERTGDLQVGLGTDLLTPLTQMLIDENMARIHLQDVPGNAFASFFDRPRLEEAIPELKKFAPSSEIWAELILRTPLRMVDTKASLVAPKPGDVQPAEAPAVPQFQFDIESAIISVAVREAADKPWIALAEFDLGVRQGAELAVDKPDFVHRSLLLRWKGDVDVIAEGSYVSTYSPDDPKLNANVIRDLFREGWTNWVGSGPARQIDVPDVDFGESMMRLSDAGWSPPYLFAQFTPPGIKITNGSDVTMTYQIRKPTSEWSPLLELPAGESHEFEGATSFIYRTPSPDGYRMFTLPPGSHSTYRSRNGAPPQLFLSDAEE